MIGPRSVALAACGVVSLAAVAGAGRPAATSTGPGARPDPVLPRVDSLLQDYVDRRRIAGAVTLVIRDGEVVHRAAHGVRDVSTGEPLRVDDIFRIASQTKAVTSVAAMMLVEAGRLSLDDPVSRHLPELRSLVVGRPEGGAVRLERAAREVTIRDLLTHTSGISYGTEPHLEPLYADAGLDGWYFADEIRPMRDLVRRLPELPLAGQPGERWIYGLGVDVLGVVVERVTGRSLGEVFERRIFEPLGMDDTGFHVPAERSARLAAVHSVGPGGVVRAPARGPVGQGAYAVRRVVAQSGGAGLVSTADDYARFLEMLLAGGERRGVRLLSPESVRAMTTNQVGDMYVADGYGFGLGFEVKLEPGGPDGWDVPGAARPGAFGWGGAYHSTYWVDPEHELIGIFLTQLIPATGLDVRQRFKALVYEELALSP